MRVNTAEHREEHEPISRDASRKVVVVVSRDPVFRAALREALAAPLRDVVVGDDAAVFEQVDGWLTEWRDLDNVEGVIIDLGDDILPGVDAFDAIRRRDAATFVILLARGLGSLGAARLGANFILEGDVEPSAVANALEQQKNR